ncbi:Uma2 family endonuclease [Streptomyces sp. NPDC102259]|uniref:Uma2 family endonuclease n=1 Tax=Streptomyces sp. NPDC102259 TaxID=3366148 RepID=UPI00381F9E5D
MGYVKMRAIAEELEAFAEALEGTWRAEIGPSGPVLAMRRPSNRHQGTLHRIREQLDAQLPTTHPGHVCANGPLIERPAIARMRRPDAVVIPEAVLDEEGLAVDSTHVLAVVEILPPSAPNHDLIEKLADYPAMGIPCFMIVGPRKGTIEVHSDPSRGRYRHTESYIYGDKVPFGPWTVETDDFRRYGKAGDRTD